MVKPFFVCAIIAGDPSMMESVEDYGKILSSINCFYPKIARGKTHPQEGRMYPYGYRSNRLDGGFGQYSCLPNSNKEEWKDFSAKMEKIGNHYFRILSMYFPKLARNFRKIRDDNHSPGIGESHAGNFMTAFDFASAAHFDPLDTTYAFGVCLILEKGHWQMDSSFSLSFVLP